MPNLETQPTIVNVDKTVREFPHLVGLHLSDAQPLGHTLVSLGVDEAEVGDWTIHSGRPSANMPETPQTVVLSPLEVSSEMHIKMRPSGNVDRRQAYTAAFKPAVGKVVLRNLAGAVLDNNENQPFELRNAKDIKFASYFLGLGAAAVGAKYGLDIKPKSAFEGMGYAFGGALAARGVAAYFTSKGRYIKRQIKEILKREPDLEKELGDSILPIYER